MGLKPVKVSQLNNYIKRILQTDPILGSIAVLGEVSNLKFHASGHTYFSLKDETSRVNCFLPSSKKELADELEEGCEVILRGYIYLYERGGSYSINVKDIEQAGRGELAVKFEKLKKRLDSLGYFEKEKKKALPQFPQKIAVVTSETGAAIRDILKIIRNKNDLVDVLICPVLVQGPNAAGEISAAIDHLNTDYSDIDLIITGRGGGSAEELSAFNEEIVAHSIYESNIPVISAVGHETDFTIADFVADIRAETPTAAADMAVPDIGILKENLFFYKRELMQGISRILENKRNYLEILNPHRLGSDIQGRCVVEQMRIDAIMQEITTSVRLKVSALEEKMMHLKETVDALNPKATMSRGFSVLTDTNGNIIKDICDVLNVGDMIKIEAERGKAEACITKIWRDE